MQDTQEIWDSEPYEELAPNYYAMAGQLVDRVGIETGDRVVDIGCGTGSVAIAATRQGGDVTAVDIEATMLDRARENAATAGVSVDWRAGSAGDLPVDDDSIDVTLSSLGHMYEDPPDAATAELLRVTRPGGRIGFTSWTPTSLYPFMGSVMLTYLDPADRPEFSEPPFAWGDSETVRDRLGEAVSQLTFETESVYYPALSPAHFWEETARLSGLFRQSLQTVAESERESLREEMIETIQPYYDDRRQGVELEYLLTVAQR